MPKLLLATANPGKQREFRQLLADCGWELVTPQQLGIELAAEEGYSSYQQNAAAKAAAAAQASGLVALADDSGLEVDALAGAPGPLSARYGGHGLDDRGRLELVLARMRSVPWTERDARFRCVVAVAQPTGEVATCEATVDGLIAWQPKGEGGFGYDPIFYLPELGLTMAELSAENKNAISHRGQAARKAKEILLGIFAHPVSVGDSLWRELVEG